MKSLLSLVILLEILFTSCGMQISVEDTDTLEMATITIGEGVTPLPINNQLIGFNTIYSHTSDSFWSDTQIKSAMTQMGVSFLRWPGGAPTNRYHWNDLNGQGWRDNWDPSYDSSYDMPASKFTDLAEHIAICREVGAEPLVGINQGSGLKWGRVQDALDHAKALVQHCVDQGYGVSHYYLDNEPYHKGANYRMTWQEYADQINLYVPAIKAIDPNAKIIINWEKVRPASLWNILAAAGDNIDVVEVHWYWNNGQVRFDDWCAQRPMNSTSQWYAEGGTYVEEIEWFYQKCQSLGYDHIKLASLEWNVGKSASLADYPTKYENTIMQAEMLMQFIAGGLEFATFWPVFWPKLPNDKSYSANRYLMDPTNGYELSPSLDMFSMLSEAMGKSVYKVTSTNPAIYQLAVGSGDKSEMLVYTHSKSEVGVWITLESIEYSNVVYELLQPESAARLDGSMSVQPSSSVEYDAAAGYYKYYLPAYSFGLIKLSN